MSQEYDVPTHDTDCIARYPHLQELYLTPVLLSWGKVNWSFTEKQNYVPVPITGMNISPNKSLKNYKHETNVIWVEKFDYSKEVVSDVVIHRGDCRDFLHYNHGNMIDEVSADRELVIRAFAIEKLRKFSGIASIRTIDKSIYTVSLKPNLFLQPDYYTSDMNKSFAKYYKVKH